MAKRKKRLEKGIDSIEEQIKEHRQKLEDAKVNGLFELADYYEKDINRLERQKEQKKEKLERD